MSASPMTLVAPLPPTTTTTTDDILKLQGVESPMINSSSFAAAAGSNLTTSTTTTTAMYRMVALDLDGTLLQSNHKMADEQATYLRNLHRRGFIICIATGRAIPSVYEHIEKLNLPVPIPVVCSNGARGMFCSPNQSKQEVFFDPVPIDVVQRAIKLGNQLGYATQYYFEDSIYANQKNESHYRITGLYSNLTGSTVEHVEDDFESFLCQGKLPSKILILFEEKYHTDAMTAYTKEFTSSSSNSNHHQQQQTAPPTATATIVGGAYNWFLEILNPMVTKGHGLLKMCDTLGIPIEQCIAMGDGTNDIEFLQMAGFGIAMKNARSTVQQVADEVMDWNNNEHGVMKTLQRLEQQGLLHFK